MLNVNIEILGIGGAGACFISAVVSLITKRFTAENFRYLKRGPALLSFCISGVMGVGGPWARTTNRPDQIKASEM